MRDSLLAAGLVLAASSTALAQEAPRVEVFGGYSAVRDDGETTSGWNAAAGYSLTRRFGIVADLSGHYGTLDLLSAMAGPSATIRRGKLAPFAHALFGVVRTTESITVLRVKISETEDAFGMQFGGGVDVELTKKLSLRLFQGDYRIAKAGGKSQNSARFSAGIVLRAGKK